VTIIAQQWIKNLDNKIDLRLAPEEALRKITNLGGKEPEQYVCIQSRSGFPKNRSHDLVI
jgi:hypothetical protein